jgi:hypothetical protein
MFAADVCSIRGAVPSDLGFYKKHFTASQSKPNLN